MKIDWYFDFISPYAYFQLYELEHGHPEIAFNPVPVLFAGLLRHHEHKGPAEITSKRILTYRFCQWYAETNAIPFRFPTHHPFKAILPLRLCIAMGASADAIRDIFHTIWVEGKDLNDPETLEAFCAAHGVDNVGERVADQAVKDALKANTDAALERGVFGVPTLVIGDELFWGVDTQEMALKYLADPGFLDTPEYARLRDLPSGV